MKNVIKIRLIHTFADNPEKEYIQEFFRFIGCLVYAETVEAGEWTQHLKKTNDDDGVDIVLNYYDNNLFYRCSRNRIYLYFKFDDKTCEITRLPLKDERKETVKKYSSKKCARQMALSLLIKAIWEDDIENQAEIERIKEVYTPTNGNSDLFYILQIKSCYNIMENKTVIDTYQRALKLMESVTKIVRYNSEIRGILEALWAVQCVLVGTNPYIVYARINVAIHMWDIVNKTYGLQHVSSFNAIPMYKLNHWLEQLLRNSPWFITAYLLMANLWKMLDRGEELYYYKRALNLLEYTCFSCYRADIYCRIGKYWLSAEEFERARYNYDTALANDPQNIQAMLNKARYELLEARTRASEMWLGKCEKKLYCSDLRLITKLTFEELLQCFEIFDLYIIKCIHVNRENELRNNIEFMYIVVSVIEQSTLLRIVADSDEQDFQGLVGFQEWADWTYWLYKVMEGMRELSRADFVNGSVAEKLAKWGHTMNKK